MATNIYPNSRWSWYVIHGIPSTISNKNTVEVSARIANEIASVSGLSLTQPPRWLSSPDDITRRGSGTIIVSLPGKVETLGLSTLYLFSRDCPLERHDRTTAPRNVISARSSASPGDMHCLSRLWNLHRP